MHPHRSLLGSIAVVMTIGSACKGSTAVEFLVPGSMTMEPSDTSIRQRGEFSLRVTVYDTAGSPIPLRPTFVSTDATRVLVTSTGLVRSVGPVGSATVVATLGPFQAQAHVTIIDSALAGRVPLNGNPYGLAVSPTGIAYITQLTEGRLARVDLPSLALQPDLTVGSAPTDVAFNTAGNRAYVTNQFSQSVSVVDVATNTPVDGIPVTGDPYEVLITPGDSLLYVTTNVDSVYGIRLATKEVVAAFQVPATANGLVAHDTLLYVSTRAGGTVVEFNLRTRAQGRTFMVGGVPQELALSNNGSVLYIANEDGYVQFWDVATNTQIGTNVPLPGGGGFGLARRPGTNLLYVTTAYLGGRIHVVNAASRSVVGTIVVGGSPRRVGFAPGGVGLVSNEAGWLDVLH